MTDGFATTRWSLVLAAGHAPERAREAMEWLCQVYWHPLYTYVRRRGYSPDDALDLVQGFFAEILENSPLQRVDPARGPLRAYMLGALKNYLSHQRDRDQAQKRRADRPKYQVSLDDAESAYRLEVQAVGGAEGDAESDPATAYDRRWALAVFDRALTALKRDYESSGRSTQFDRLQGYLSGEDETTYRDAADELGMTEGAIKVAVHRLRGRLGHFLREEVAQTVARQGDVDEELRYLLQVM